MAETVGVQRGAVWHNTSTLTRWVIRLLYAQIFIGAVSVASGVFEYRLLQNFASGLYYSREQMMADAHANDLRQLYIMLVSALIFIIAALLILRWLYVSYRNASHLSTSQLHHRPSMAVVWYFIPIANLWKPYQVMKELWASASACGRGEVERTSGYLCLWWGLWLVGGSLAVLAVYLGWESRNLQDLLFTSATTIASDVTGISLSMVFMLMVKDITERLDNCHHSGAVGSP